MLVRVYLSVVEVVLDTGAGLRRSKTRQEFSFLGWSYSTGDTVRLMWSRADSEGYFCWGYHNSERWPSQSWALAAVMIQHIIRLFDDPSSLPHLCTPTARLPALTSVQRSRISLRERKDEEVWGGRKCIIYRLFYCHQASFQLTKSIIFHARFN